MSEENVTATDATETAIPAPEVDPVEAKIAALEAEVLALKDQALRYAAEAENTKRRAEREMNDARAYAITRFARDLLGVADNLSRALMAAPRDHADAAVNTLVQGLDMTEKALLTAFDSNGLKRIDPAKGDKFDPNLHQAVMEATDPDVLQGGVVMVMAAGYELFGRVVRPAMVSVAAKGSGSADAVAAAAAAKAYSASGNA